MAAILRELRNHVSYSLLIGCVLSIASVNLADAIVARTSTYHHFNQPERVGVTNGGAGSVDRSGGLSGTRSTARGALAAVSSQSQASGVRDDNDDIRNNAEIGTERGGATSNFDAESFSDSPRNINGNKPSAISDNFGEKPQTGSDAGDGSGRLTGSSDNQPSQAFSRGSARSNNDRPVGSRYLAAKASSVPATRAQFGQQLLQKFTVSNTASTFSTNDIASGSGSHSSSSAVNPRGDELDRSESSGRDVNQRTAQTGSGSYTDAVSSNRASGVLRSGYGQSSYGRSRYFPANYSPYGIRQPFYRPNVGYSGYQSAAAQRFMSSSGRYPYAQYAAVRPSAQYQQAAAAPQRYNSAAASNLYGRYSPFSSFSAFGQQQQQRQHHQQQQYPQQQQQQQQQPIRYTSSSVNTGSSYPSYSSSNSGTAQSGSSGVRYYSVSSYSTEYPTAAAAETATAPTVSSYDPPAVSECPAVSDDVCYGKDAGHYAHPDSSSRHCFIQCDQYGEPFVRQCAGNTRWKSASEEPALGNMCE